jgi:putative nucleotidyltransferase with HDIG domain
MPRDTIQKTSPEAKVYHSALQLFDSLYFQGVIEPISSLEKSSGSKPVIIIRNNVAQECRLDHVLTVSTAQQFITNRLNAIPLAFRDDIKNLLDRMMFRNIIYNDQITAKAGEELISSLSQTRGMVQEGEKVISRGEVVTNDKYQILISLKKEYEVRLGSNSKYFAILAGQIILIVLALVVLGLFLYFFRPEIFESNSKVSLILLIIIMMVFGVAMLMRFQPWLLYVAPLCLVPMVMRIFFDTRVALYVHIITIIIIGFLVPNSFEFVFLQLITGIITIFSVVNFKRRQQFVLTSLLVFASYSVVYIGLFLIQEGQLQGIKLLNFSLFAFAALLMLMAYPLIAILERIFGLVTDVTLLEICDTNSKLLRELSSRAPGTFHHSLQVANLAEEIISEIGGNPLLVRAGALHHDIGKMEMAPYFIENQATGYNPHEELTPEESAEIIVSHVKRGVEKARKHNLPEAVIDFIRTHHGTRTTGYFYYQQKQLMGDEPFDDKLFRYRGPVPFSKETCAMMVADSVEAASRSNKKPDEQSINTLVDRIIDQQIADKQFDNAGITFKELTKIRKILKKKLMHIYHIRIEYPG